MTKKALLFFIAFFPFFTYAQRNVLKKADFLCAQGEVSLKKEDFKKSLECFDRAATIYKGKEAYYQYSYATVMAIEVALNKGSNRYDTLLEDILLIEETLKKHLPNRMDTCSFYPLLLQNTGVIYGTLEDKENQKKYYQNLLQLGLKLEGEKGKQCLIDAYYDFALVSSLERQWEKSIEFGKKCLDIATEVNDSSDIVYALGILATTFGDLGQLKKANDLLNNALLYTQRDKSKTPIYATLGENYADLGDYLLSASYFEQAINIGLNTGDEFNKRILPTQFGFIRGLTNLKKYDKALLEIDKVLDLYTQNHLKPDKFLIRGLVYKTKIYLLQKNYKEANHWVQKGLKIAPKSPDVFLIRAQIANELKNHDDALIYIDKAIRYLTNDASFASNSLPKLEIISDYGHYFDILAVKANTLFLIGKEKKDIGLLKQAMVNYQFIDNLMHEAQKSIRNPISRQRISFHLKELYINAIANLYELYQLSPQEQYIEDAFRYSELTKNLMVAENIQKQNIQRYADLPKRLFKREQDLVSKIEQYSFLLTNYKTSLTPENITQTMEQLNRAKKSLNALIDTFETQYPDYYALRYDRALSNLQENTHSLIEENEVLIEYFLGRKQGFAILKDADKNNHIVRLDLPKDWNRLIKDFRSQLIRQDSTWSRTSNRLFQVFVEPLLPIIKDRSIVFILDEDLSTIPFEILVEQSQTPSFQINYSTLPYFFLNRNIRYLFSANIALLSQKGRNQWSENKILGFAPGFETPSDSLLFPVKNRGLAAKVKPLHQSKEELQLISDIFDGDYYYYENATEEILCKNLEKYRMLHLITHTGIDQDNNDASWMILYPGDTLHYDGLAHNFEFYSSHINADLVVLSACNVGYGQLKKGEGIESISHAVSYAGGSNIVFSQWPASVYTTPQIMESFYKNIAQKTPIGQALNNAKRDFLQHGETIYSHPFFWATFVYYGNETILDNLPTPRRFPTNLLFLTGAFLLGILLLGIKIFR